MVNELNEKRSLYVPELKRLVRFVNPDTGEHTNHAEGYFGKLARYIASHSGSNCSSYNLIMHVAYSKCCFDYA